MTTDLLQHIRRDLTARSDPKAGEAAKRYFKEPVKFYGLTLPATHKIAATYLPEVKKLTKAEAFNLCESLWRSDYSEEAFIACDFVYTFRHQFEASDFAVFEQWINRYVNNWAKCDSFCNHSVAAVVEKYPQFIANLKLWTASDNRWVRRAAAVTLVLPAKHGRFLPEVFAIADALLLDPDDLVQKGYGWLLKEASKAHQREVFDYVIKHKAVMPRTALRYAIEKMPPELKKQAMAR